MQGQLTLCLLVDVPETRDVLKELLFAAKQLGMELDFKPVARRRRRRGRRPPERRRRYVITAIGPTLGAPHLHAIASALAAEGANIEKIGRLSENTLASVEIHALLPPGRDSDALKRTLLAVATSAGFDVSLQRESLYRRSKRLVVMDMDSTLIRIEVIDELARAAGVGAEVSRITERAMQGEMDYDESLRQRVGLLEGLDVAVLDQLAAEPAADRRRRDAGPRAQAPRLQDRRHQRRLLARRRGAQATAGHRLRLLEQPRGRRGASSPAASSGRS